MKVFYVCSYGGCGSTILSKYLKNFGEVFHIHSRKPPLKLQYVGGKDTYYEWFNGIEITDEDYQTKEYYVLYIFRNPIKAIYSRFNMREHLLHIQCPNPNIKSHNVAKQKSDLYHIEEFFDNYTNKNLQKNYNIICVKYETLFDNFKQLNELLDIPDKPELYPIKKERKITDKNQVIFEEIYSNLIKKINKMPAISIN